jgi:Protein of unknown function (DUF4232)
MPVCTPPQLHLVAGFQGAAAGQFLQTFTFVNVSRRTCTLEGWPRLVGIPSRRVVQAKPVVRVVVRPGGAASFDVFGEDWNHRADTPCPVTRSVQVIPPGGNAALSVAVRMPNCQGHEVAPMIAGRVDRDAWSTVVGPGTARGP